MITKVILTRDEVDTMIAREASYTLTGRPRDEMDAVVAGSYGYGDVTVTFTPKKAEPEPVVDTVTMGRNMTADEIREQFKRKNGRFPTLKDMEFFTIDDLIPAAVSESGV